MLRRIHPCLVPVGVLLRGAVTGGNRAHLEAEHGASDLDVERLAELQRRVAKVALHPLPLGIADLADPPILKKGEGRQQHQQRTGEQGEARRAGQLHGVECNTDKNPVSD